MVTQGRAKQLSGRERVARRAILLPKLHHIFAKPLILGDIS